MKSLKKILIIVSMLGCMLVLASCDEIHFHQFENATCTKAQVCDCGATKGEPLGHKYAEAATCTEPQICIRCGKTGTPQLGHDFTDVSCTNDQICTRCGVIGQTALGHSYSNATCTKPAICSRCGNISGEAIGHNYSKATCETPSKCLNCNETNGEPLGHQYADNSCVRCKKIDPKSLPVKLSELHVIDYKWYYNDDSYIDSFGNSHIDVHEYFVGSYSIFNTNNEYKTFSASLVAGSYNDSAASYIIEIYADETLVWEYKGYSKFTGKVDVFADINYAKTLKIAVSGYSPYNCSIGIVDASVKR